MKLTAVFIRELKRSFLELINGKRLLDTLTITSKVCVRYMSMLIANDSFFKYHEIFIKRFEVLCGNDERSIKLA